MKYFKLVRVAYIEDGTFGVLFDENTPFCLTLEREWKDNRRGESCIPLGIYSCSRIISPKFGNTFKVRNVEGRSHILFHKGNLEDDSHGCILLGEEYGRYKDKIAILSSGRAFNEFWGRLKGLMNFELEVKDGV
jgi:hypothetical protein